MVNFWYENLSLFTLLTIKLMLSSLLFSERFGRYVLGPFSGTLKMEGCWILIPVRYSPNFIFGATRKVLPQSCNPWEQYFFICYTEAMKLLDDDSEQ